MATISRLSVALIADPKGFNQGMKSASKAMDGFKDRALGLGTAVAAIGGVGIGLLLNDLIDVNAKFQTLKSSLKTVTGGAEEADTAFKLIEKFAISTPFALEEVVQSFIKLKARGLDPSERALNSYGNTSSALGKSLDQMIEAVADAATGQFERLREFNIIASKQGDNVALTFNGITTTIANNAEAIQGYLMGIGETTFGSAMSDQMQNLTPAFSNLEAAFQGLQVTIGEAGLNQVIADLVNGTTDWINSLDKDQIKGWVQTALNGMADVAEGAMGVVDFLDRNPFLTEAGVIGYLLFGKKGIAAVAAGQAFMEGISNVTARIGDQLLGDSGITFTGQLEKEINRLEQLETMLARNPGEASGLIEDSIRTQTTLINELQKSVSGVRSGQGIGLSDFNTSQGFSTFDEWAKAIRNVEDPEIKKQTGLLENVVEVLRTNAGAVAG